MTTPLNATPPLVDQLISLIQTNPSNASDQKILHVARKIIKQSQENPLDLDKGLLIKASFMIIKEVGKDNPDCSKPLAEILNTLERILDLEKNRKIKRAAFYFFLGGLVRSHI